MQLADLTAMYKSRLTPEGQKQFVLLGENDLGENLNPGGLE